MIVGNFKNSSDLADKKALAMRLLQIEVENQEEIGRRFASIDSPYVPPEIPVQVKSLAQVEQDESELTNRLTTALVKIGIKDIIAKQAVNGFLTNDVGTIQDVVNLIRSVPEIKKRFASLSPEDIDTDHLIRIMGYVARDYQSTNGFAFDKNGKLASSYADIMKLLPEVKDVVKLMTILKTIKSTGFGETSYITRAIDDAIQKTQYTEKIIKDINKVLPTLSERKISKGEEEEGDKKSEISLAVEDFKKIILSGLVYGRNEVNKALMSMPPDGKLNSLDELEEFLIDLLSKPFKQEDFIEASEDLKEYIMLPDYSNIKFASPRRGYALQPSVFTAKQDREEREEFNQLLGDIDIAGLEENEELMNLDQYESRLYKEIFAESIEEIAAASEEKAEETMSAIDSPFTLGEIDYKSPILLIGSDVYNRALINVKSVLPTINKDNFTTLLALTPEEGFIDESLIPKGSKQKNIFDDVLMLYGAIFDVNNLKRLTKGLKDKSLANQLLGIDIFSPLKFIRDKVEIFEPIVEDARKTIELLKYSIKEISKRITTIKNKASKLTARDRNRSLEKDSEYADFMEYKKNLKIKNERKQFSPQEIYKIIKGVDQEKYNRLTPEGRAEVSKISGKLLTKNGVFQQRNMQVPERVYDVVAMDGYEDLVNYYPHSKPDTQFSKVIGLGANGQQKIPVKNKSGFNPKRIKVGKGISVDEEPKYSRFGKWVIHQKQLKDLDKLNLRYPSMQYINNVRPMSVSPDYKDVLLDILESNKLEDRKYKRLTKEEQAHFTKVMEGSGLASKFKFKGVGAINTTEDEDRFKLLLGEMKAGNNNTKMITELKSLINKFIKEGRIDQKEGYSLLSDINKI